ncbi:alpha/beta hydrolase [uncultured Hoeflea sp.]|uniref:alpha/beta hydrolase n=1 Tax=uncultured Hoeflea sp. TaxID=538666 RepID=UPI00260A4384|nr:alpha/beta hydrolase [uncultured Hoeflea sp.]
MPERPSPYDRLLDAETWAFIDQSDAHYPPDAVAMDVTDQRRVYDALCRAFDAGRPSGVTTTDQHIAGPATQIPLRTYRTGNGSPRATVLYLHGGGFVVGGLESHDSVCAELCGRTGYEVIAVDYRLAPEHCHPAQFEDALAAYRHVAAASEHPVVLCGDSAGGNLAAGIANATRSERRKPAGQVLIYPALGNEVTRGSFITHAHAPLLTTADMVYYERLRAGGEAPVDDPTFTPLTAGDFTGLPPTVVFTAACDPLAGDGPAYCAKIVGAGGKARCIEEEGLVHGYLRARHSVSRARDSFTRMIDALATLGAEEWPD